MERVIFDRMAELDQTHWWFVARRRILAEIIRRRVAPPPGARILEIGCGTGHNLAMLGRFGAVDALELDDAAREIAQKRLGRPIGSAALPALDGVPDGHYDLITLLDVLEHVEPDEASLQAIRAKLKPGGTLLITVPANRWMWSAHDVLHHHMRRYERGQLRAMIDRAGYETNLLSHFNTVLFPLAALARIFGKLTGRGEADDAQPPAPLNGIFTQALGIERHLLGRVPLPFGVSLIAVLRAPAQAPDRAQAQAQAPLPAGAAG